MRRRKQNSTNEPITAEDALIAVGMIGRLTKEVIEAHESNEHNGARCNIERINLLAFVAANLDIEPTSFNDPTLFMSRYIFHCKHLSEVGS